MTAKESKDSGTRSRLAWAAAYLAAALLLATAMGLAWWHEQHRPWQAEVAALNRLKARRLAARLVSHGMPAPAARARAAALADRKPELIELVPTATGRVERCLTCHQDIEPVGPSHPPEAIGCVACHGGQGAGLTKEAAHRGLLGRNPSALPSARASCGGRGALAGRCHAGRELPAADMVYRVRRTIMATMTGVITSLRVAWLAQPDLSARLAARAVDDPRRPSPPPAGTVPALLAMPGGPPPMTDFAHLAGEQWRKFCARCHLNAQRPAGLSAHGAGCAACHGRRAPDGRYHGQDLCIDPDQPGHAREHRLFHTPAEDNCRRCHNRSGRLGLSYRGEMEDESGAVPWHDANPRYTQSGGRGVRRLLPDVHAEKGMSCIDCHTASEIMGDGRLYGRMRFATEIRCASCHGGPDGPPLLGQADAATRYEASFGPLKGAAPLKEGERLALSAKGRPLANLRAGEKGLVLHLRSRPGKTLVCPRVDNDPRHNLPGHRRLACQACHSRWTPQCYGCHDYRRPDGKMWDFAAGRPTPGSWRETRDLYRFRGSVLAMAGDGRIRPFVPGCQVALTVQDRTGRPQGKALRVARGGPAGSGLVMTPISPHTTRSEVRPCEDCHGSRRALGLGGGPVLPGRAAAVARSDLSALDRGADWDALTNGRGDWLMGTTHQGARPLSRQELARVLRFGACLPCHRRPDDKVVLDPRRAYARIAPGGDLHQRHRLDVERALR